MGGNMPTKILGAAASLLLAIGLSGTARAGADPLFAAAKLREYCKACHAVGTMKFIQSDDDRVLWDGLFADRAPRSGKIWADAIAEVLAWPSDAAPPFDTTMDPPSNRDWMPKGAKRLDLAADTFGGIASRRLILQAIRERSRLDGD